MRIVVFWMNHTDFKYLIVRTCVYVFIVEIFLDFLTRLMSTGRCRTYGSKHPITEFTQCTFIFAFLTDTHTYTTFVQVDFFEYEMVI